MKEMTHSSSYLFRMHIIDGEQTDRHSEKEKKNQSFENLMIGKYASKLPVVTAER